jgi:guanine deaminase
VKNLPEGDIATMPKKKLRASSPSGPGVDTELFMRRAIALSRDAILRRDGGPFGCVVVKEGKIIGEGWNQVIANNDPTAHGEIVAIRKACRELKTFSLDGCDLYTSSEPCPMCLAAIYWSRIARIFFGNTRADAADSGFDDVMIHSELSKTAESRLIPASQVLADEADEVFREFATDPNHVHY